MMVDDNDVVGVNNKIDDVDHDEKSNGKMVN